MDGDDKGKTGGGTSPDALFDDLAATVAVRTVEPSPLPPSTEGDSGEGRIVVSKNASVSTVGPLRDTNIANVEQEFTSSTQNHWYLHREQHGGEGEQYPPQWSGWTFQKRYQTMWEPK